MEKGFKYTVCDHSYCNTVVTVCHRGMITLISSEGEEFKVEEDVAMQAGMIKAMVQSGLRETDTMTMKFPEISSRILSTVIEYLQYKKKHQNSTDPIPEFPIDPQIAAELLVASNYLDC